MGKDHPGNHITKNRSCTDVICVLVFIVFLGGWVGVGVIGLLGGHPEQLVYPSNSRGELCGRGVHEDKPYVLFHDPTQCLSLSAIFGCPTPQICVQSCPDQTTSLYAFAFYKNGGGAGTFDQFDEDYQRQFCVPEVTDPKYDDSWEEAKDNTTGNVTDAEGNPISNSDGDITVEKVGKMINYLLDVLNARGFAEQVWADLVTSKWMILAGMGVGLGVAFIWIILMRFIASIMVWTSLIATLGLLGLASAYSWVKYSAFKDGEMTVTASGSGDSITNTFDAYLQLRNTWLALFIISSTLLVIIALITLFLRKRLMLAIALINEASKAVGSIMSSLFFPLVSFLLQVVVMAWFVVTAIYLASSGTQQYSWASRNETGTTEFCPDTTVGQPCQEGENNTVTADCECIFVKFGNDDLHNYLQLYNLFGLFWGLCFVTALGEMVLAGAFASWYWVLDKSDIPAFPVLNSFGRTLRYHTGTLAFGSLIIAIIKSIRAAIQYIEDKLKEKGADKGPVKVLLCLCKCCFWCLEKFMKFINRNAYILTAINGSNFCSSAKEAFGLILRNCVRVVVLDKVTDFLLFLGKLVVTSIVALLSFFYFSGGLNSKVPFDVEEPNLNYYFVPVFLITVGVYFTASVFFSVYAMAVDTLFLSCLVDMEKNDGSREKPYFMTKSLRNILNLKQKKHKD